MLSDEVTPVISKLYLTVLGHFAGLRYMHEGILDIIFQHVYEHTQKK